MMLRLTVNQRDMLLRCHEQGYSEPTLRNLYTWRRTAASLARRGLVRLAKYGSMAVLTAAGYAWVEAQARPDRVCRCRRPKPGQLAGRCLACLGTRKGKEVLW